MGLFSIKKKGWTCKGCGQVVAIKDIGAVMKEGKVTIPTSGNCENMVSQNAEVLCGRCAMKVTGMTIKNKANDEKRPLTMTELRSLEEQLRSENLQDVYLKLKNREKLPENSARYSSMTFDQEGTTFVDFTCPKCSEETRIILQGTSIKTIDEQLGFYTRMHEKVPMTCPSCSHNFTLYK